MFETLVAKLEQSPNIKEVGYKGNDFINVILGNSYYDSYKNNTLNINDFISDIDLTSYHISLETYHNTFFVMITFISIFPGGYNIKVMKNSIIENYSDYLVVE